MRLPRVTFVPAAKANIAAAFALVVALFGARPAEPAPRPKTSPGAVGTNSVWMDVQDAFLPEFDIAIWIVPSTTALVPFSLASPAPPGGVSVNTISNLIPGLSSVYFLQGQTQATRSETFDAEQFIEYSPGWEARSGYLAINFASPPPGIDIVDPSNMSIFEVRETGVASRGEPVDCMICNLITLFCYCVYGDPDVCLPDSIECIPEPTPRSVQSREIRPNSPRAVAGDLDFSFVDVLRRYRDEVLSTTPEGLFYTDFYRTHSTDMVRAAIASPSLLVRLYRAQFDWTAGFQALVDGQGDTFTVTQSMEDDLLGIFSTVESVGSSTLAQSLAFERTRLQLDQVAGLTMTGFQTQIETLGGISAVEPMSWGRVKVLYR